MDLLPIACWKQWRVYHATGHSGRTIRLKMHIGLGQSRSTPMIRMARKNLIRRSNVRQSGMPILDLRLKVAQLRYAVARARRAAPDRDEDEIGGELKPFHQVLMAALEGFARDFEQPT